jgi:NAD(P)H-dependent FMN reductase
MKPDDLNSIDHETIVGISLSAKQGKKSSSNSIMAYMIDQLGKGYPNVVHLLFTDYTLPYFTGLMPHEVKDISYRLIYSLIEKCRALILSVPCYWSGISGVSKNFFDVLCGPLYDYPDTYKSVFHNKIIGVIVIGADEMSAMEGKNQIEKITLAVGAILIPKIVIISNPREIDGEEEKRINEELLQLNLQLVQKLREHGPYSNNI